MQLRRCVRLSTHFGAAAAASAAAAALVTSQGMDEGGLDYALNRAIDAYYNDRAWFRSLQVRRREACSADLS